VRQDAINRLLGGEGSIPQATASQATVTGPPMADVGEEAVPRSPERIGPYRLGRLVGAGGMGLVYEALDEERGSTVALKTLAGLGSTTRLRRFKSEFRSVTDISHPNLLRVYELITDGKRWAFTMEMIDGVDFVAHTRGAAEVTLCAALRQLVEGIIALHACGLLHLDLKPANVLVERGGRVVILDFGLVRALDAGDDAHPWVGTPTHMAPEQARGGALTPACDWYAVGVILFEALTGRLPFPGGVDEVLRAEGPVSAPDPRQWAPDAPSTLCDLCVALLAMDPEWRADGRDVLLALGDGGEVVTSAAPVVRLIGRDEALAALDAAFAARGAGCVGVHLRGASGIGKTALLDHFVRELRSRGALVLVGRCHERETTPHKGLDAIFEGLAAHIEARSDVPSEWLTDLDEALQMFPALARPTLASSVAPDEAPAARHQAIQKLRAVLSRLASERPLVLAIDDVQWGDRDGAGLLSDLLAAPAPALALVILAGRPAGPEVPESDQFLAVLRERPPAWAGLVDVDLAPLAEDAARELALAHVGPERAEDAGHIVAEAAGNPFLIEELSRHAADTRSLQALVDRRVCALPDAARRVLRVVAVAAQPLPQALAWAAAGALGEPHRVFTNLRAASLIRAGGPRDRDVVETYHDRIRDAVVAALASKDHVELHRSLAEAFDRCSPDEPERLARHWHGAGELTRAAHHAERAARVAEHAFAFERAAAWLADAAAWNPSDQPRVHALSVRRAQALVHAGHGTEAGRLYAATATDDAAGHDLQRRAIDAYLTAGCIDEGLGLARPLLAKLSVGAPANSPRITIELLLATVRLLWRGPEIRLPVPTAAIDPAAVLRVDLCWSLGRGLSNTIPRLGTVFMLRSLLLAQDLGDPLRVARGFAYLGGILPALGPRAARRGEAFLHRAEALGAGDSITRGSVEIWGAFRWLLVGAWSDVVAAVERGIGWLAAVRTDTSWERTVGECFALAALEQSGSWRALGVRAEAGLTDARARGDRYAEVVFSQFLAQVRLAGGDLAEFDALLAGSGATWTRDEYTLQHFYALRLAILRQLYVGDTLGAERDLSAAWPKIRGSELLTAPPSRIEVWLLVARVGLARAVAAPRDRAPLRRAIRAIRALRRVSRRDVPAQALLLEACLEACSGRPSAARFREGAEALAALDMPLLAACAALRGAEIRGNRTAAVAAEARLADCGIPAPDRWLAIYAPCPAAVS